MSDVHSDIPEMIANFGSSKIFSERTNADVNGASLELGINQGKVTTIGGLPVAGVGGGNMVVLHGMTSTWWDIARAQAEGKTVYLSFGIPGFFSTIVGPIKNSLGTLEDGNKIQAIKRAWYASAYQKDFNLINLAYRKPTEPQRSGEEDDGEEEPVEYQDGFTPFTYDEAMQLTQGTLPLERFDLYMYARGSQDYDDYRDYNGYLYPKVPSSYSESDEPLDFSEYVPNLDDPTERENAQHGYNRWQVNAGHIVKDYTTTDEYIRSLVGYYLDEIPSAILDKYTARLNQFNMAFRAPAGEVVPLNIEPVYQEGYVPFEEGDAIKLITGQLPLERFAVYEYADEVVDDYYDPAIDVTLTYDFDTWISDHSVTEQDYDDWTMETYEDIVKSIQGEMLTTILGVLYDTLMPYEVDIDVTLGGILRIGLGIAYKRSMPFITPRYVAVGLPNSYAIDLKSFRDAGVDLSSIEALMAVIGQMTNGESSAIWDKIKEGSLGSAVGGLGGLIGGGLASDNNESDDNSDIDHTVTLQHGELSKGGITKLEVNRDGESLDGEDDGENNGESDDENGSDDNKSAIIALLEQLFDVTIDDPEAVTAGLVSGLADATLGRNDDIFYVFCMGMDINRRVSTIPGLEDLMNEQDIDLDLDPHKGFIIEVNGWNIFAPITGDANKGLDLTKFIDVLEEALPLIEEYGDRLPGLEDIQALIDAIADLIGVGTSLENLVDILRQVNNMTLSFSTLLNQRAMYKLVEKEWPLSLLRFDGDTMRLYSTQCLAKVAGAAPASTVISISNFGGMIGTAIAELLLRAIGNYNFELVAELILGALNPSGMDDVIKDAFEKFAPIYGLEWHGMTEIPVALGLVDGLPHNLANVHVKAGITFRTDEDEDGGITGSGVTGVLTRTKLSVENMDNDFVRSYAKLNDGTSFNDAHNAAVLGKGIIYNMAMPEDDDDSQKRSVSDGENSVGHSWEMHGEINPAVYHGKDAVQLRIEGGDGSIMDLVGTENLDNVPEYSTITGDSSDDRLIGIHNKPNSVSYHIFNKDDIIGEGDITSLKFKCASGQESRRLIYVFLKEYYDNDFDNFDTENPVYPTLTVNDLVYFGEIEFEPNGFIKIPICTINTSTGKPTPSSFPYDHSSNLLVVVMDASDEPVYDENDNPESIELLKVYYSNEENYTGYNTICRSSDESIIPIDGYSAPSSETVERLQGVSNITFGFSEPYVVPVYSYDVEVGTRAASNTDVRFVAVDGKPYSISCHIISRDEIVCNGVISSLTVFRNSHGIECGRNVDVFVSKIPTDFLPDILTKEQYRTQLLQSIMISDNMVYSGMVSSMPNGQFVIPLNNYEFRGSQNLLVIVNDHTGGESMYESDAPEVYFTPYSEPEDNNSEYNEEYRSLCFYSANPIDINDSESFGDDVDMRFCNGMLSVKLNFTEGDYVNNEPGTAKAGSENLGHFGPIPVNTFNAVGSETHMIYPAGYIRRGGKITGMRLYYSPYWAAEMTRTLRICLRHTRFSGFTSQTDFVDVPTKDPQFEGSVHFVSTVPTGGEQAQHWVEIEFDDAFVYDGFHNLLVSVYDITGNGYDVTGSFSLTPDTKNMLSIGTKTKMVDGTETTVPFGYNCVAVCEFVYAENRNDPYPMTDMDCITPDWEANRIVGSEPVDWKIVATETRAVYVKTIQAAMDAYEWFAPQGIDVYLEYDRQSIKSNRDIVSSYDINTEFDFMPPWYNGGNLRFRVFEVDRDGLFAVAEVEQLPYSYLDNDNNQPKSASSAPVFMPMPVKVTYILAASEEMGIHVFASQPKLILNLSADYWIQSDDDEGLEKSQDEESSIVLDLNPSYLYNNNIWEYSLMPPDFPYEWIDMSAYYLFMAVESGLVTVEMYVRSDYMPLVYNSHDASEPNLEYLLQEDDYVLDADMYARTEDNYGIVFVELYSRTPEYSDVVPTKHYIDTIVSLEEDPDEDAYIWDADYGHNPNNIGGYPAHIGIDSDTVTFVTITDITLPLDVNVEILEEHTGGETPYIFTSSDNPIPTNVNELYLQFGDWCDSKVIIQNTTTVHFEKDAGTGNLVIAATGAPIDLYVEGDTNSVATINPGESYVVEVIDKIYECRKANNIVSREIY